MSDTVSDPGTVVVHLEDTLAAEAAVVSAGRFHHVTVLAPAKDHEVLEYVVANTWIIVFEGLRYSS
jgi:hypothetical protein